MQRERDTTARATLSGIPRSTGVLAAIAVGASLLATDRVAAQGCYIGVPQAGAAVTLDGMMTGSEWASAGIATSNDGCLEEMADWDPAGFYIARGVTLRMQRDNTNLYVFVEVADRTPGSTTTGLGERILLQLDPGDNGGPDLHGTVPLDKRIDIEHGWNFENSTSSKLSSTLRFRASNVPNVGGSCQRRGWGLATTTSMPTAFVRSNTPPGTSALTGYTVELQIPITAIELGTGENLGLAFAVINDMNHNQEYGSAVFPTNLHFTSNSNGVLDPVTANNPIGCGDWLTPGKWGHAFVGTVPGTVKITRLPAPWNSDGIIPLKCSLSGGNPVYNSSYEYYPPAPCKIQVTARVENHNLSATEVRNVLYVWGKRDAASPTWTFMDLKKSVSIPPATTNSAGTILPGVNPVTSDPWAPASVPALIGNVEHPCMRVYTLPSTFVGMYTEAWMRAMTNLSNAQLEGFLAAYGVVDANWAQKNIHRNTNAAAGCSGLCLTLRERFKVRMSGYLAHASFGAVVDLFAPRELHAQPRDKSPGPPLYLSGQDRERYQRTDAIIQVQTMGYSTTGPYKFVEAVGGAIELLAMERVATEKVVPINFAVTNGSATEMVMIPQLVVATPPGTENFGVNLPNKPFTLAPKQTHVLEARAGIGVRPGGAPRRCFGSASPGTSLAFVGVFAIIGIAIRRRRRPPVE